MRVMSIMIMMMMLDNDGYYDDDDSDAEMVMMMNWRLGQISEDGYLIPLQEPDRSGSTQGAPPAPGTTLPANLRNRTPAYNPTSDPNYDSSSDDEPLVTDLHDDPLDEWLPSYFMSLSSATFSFRSLDAFPYPE